MSSSDSEDTSIDPSSSGEEKEESLVNQIVAKLDNSIFDGKDFLPEGCIETLITEATVMKEMGITEETKEDSRKLLSFILKDGRKIFAILIFSSFKSQALREAVTQFRRKKIGDVSLPITDVANVPFFKPPKQPWDNWSVRNFCKGQWIFLAPVFSNEKLNLQLRADHILPFTSQDNDIKSGAFGEVHQVTVHPSHHTNPVLTVRIFYICLDSVPQVFPL
jgi:hypothetical protein